MPELLKAVTGSVIRWALAGVAGYLVARNVLTEGQASEVMLTIGSGAAALLWSLWQKYRSRLKFLTALELPASATPKKVEEVIAETPTGTNVAKVMA